MAGEPADMRGRSAGRAAWPLPTARSRLDELISRTRTEGPQHIDAGDGHEVVLLSAETFQTLLTRGDALPLTQFMQGLDALATLDRGRDPDNGRDIDL